MKIFVQVRNLKVDVANFIKSIDLHFDLKRG